MSKLIKEHETIHITLSGIVQTNPTFRLSRLSPVTNEWNSVDARVSVTEAATFIRDLDVAAGDGDRAILALTRMDVYFVLVRNGDGAIYEFARN